MNTRRTPKRFEVVVTHEVAWPFHFQCNIQSLFSRSKWELKLEHGNVRCYLYVAIFEVRRGPAIRFETEID
ncbi:hypothetical protein OUZ56_000037 [Daphnia magna]|uniref:Uncharacterized protein n=1 Tax=Daphnia magna TaxID=35525 RepID=A0ABQ9ZYQ5_9CRUS|nr:hypothetical protein OUZ56_000037 [Daphnia magna]